MKSNILWSNRSLCHTGKNPLQQKRTVRFNNKPNVAIGGIREQLRQFPLRARM